MLQLFKCVFLFLLLVDVNGDVNVLDLLLVGLKLLLLGLLVEQKLLLFFFKVVFLFELGP